MLAGWTMTLALLTTAIIYDAGAEIFEFYSTEGEIARDAAPDSPLIFDAPLRISKTVAAPVNVSLLEPSFERRFRVTPAVVQPGGTFGISLRDAINADFGEAKLINITVRGVLMTETANSQLNDEIKTLQIFLTEAPTAHKSVGGEAMLTLNSTEFTASIPIPFRCEAGRSLAMLKVENSDAKFDDFAFNLTGEYAELFQLDAVENTTIERFLELKYSDDCATNDADVDDASITSLAELFGGELASDRRPKSLVLQISSASHSTPRGPPTVYLIHFEPAVVKQTHKGASFRVKCPIAAEITERARQFIPPLRIKVYTDKDVEVNLAHNFTFNMTIEDGSPVSETFYVHAITGVVIVRNPNALLIEKLDKEPQFNVSLYKDCDFVDSCEIRVRLRPFSNTVSGHRAGVGAGGDSAETAAFRFEQPVYAFAVGPGISDVGRVHLQTPLSSSIGDTSALTSFWPTVSYAISEGGASYFLIDNKTGHITYNGPLERNAKNYTIKAIAYDVATEMIETTSVQILVAGIGSSLPQIAQKFDVVEVAEDIRQPQAVYTVRGVDFDPDARLHYRVLSINCLSVLGQPLDESRCADIVHFGANGQRNGTLIFSGMSDSVTFPANNKVSEFVRLKTDALASVFVNVSVSDVNHPLEPSDYAALVIRVVNSSGNNSAPARNDTSHCQHKFDAARMTRVIQLDDSLPPNSYVYTVTVCAPSIIDEDDGTSVNDHIKVSYALSPTDDDGAGARLFSIHSDNGIIRNTASLKNAPRHMLLTIVARDDAHGRILDTTTLTVECENLIEFAPEFAKKFYSFEVTRAQFDAAASSHGSPLLIGTVIANDRNANTLQYDIVESEMSDAPFHIDTQGRIFAALKAEHGSVTPSAIFHFFVRVTDTENTKFASVPVQVRVTSSSNAGADVPRFGVLSPQKATLMENAPVNTFVAEFAATNAHRFEIRASNTSQDEKATRLADALRISAPDGTIRTFASLSDLDGLGYLLTVIAYGSTHDADNRTQEVIAHLELEVDVIATSKCKPNFVADQPLVFFLTDTKPSAIVAQLKAEIESGCELVYQFDRDSTRFGIEIDASNGRIIIGSGGIVLANADDDGRGTSYIPLVVTARSGHATASVGIELRIPLTTAYNERTSAMPFFHERELIYRVPDVLEAGSVVGHVNARGCHSTNAMYAFMDENLGANNDRFAINASSGEIRLIRAFENDNENILRALVTNNDAAYHMRVIATCRDSSGSITPQPADVYVEIIDLNNHNPQFERDMYEFSIDKKEQVGTIIGQVIAYDKDITEELHYSMEKITYYRKGAEKRLRDVFFEIDTRSGEISLRSSIAELNGGVFELTVRVRDTPSPLFTHEADAANALTLSGRSATSTVQIWICSAADYFSFILEENPLYVNTTQIALHMRTMAAAAPSKLRPVRAFLHDTRYHFVEEGREILRNSTILRVLFVDVQKGEIIAPGKVEEFIRDLILPGLKPLELYTDSTLTSDDSHVAESHNELPGVQKRQKENKAQMSPLFFTVVVFAVLLVIIFVVLAVILCYYRQQFLCERQFLRDARIAKEAMSQTKPSTIRRFALANALPPLDSIMSDRAAHFYPPNPYITEAWERDSTEPENFYYTTQEMKISMR